MGEQTNKAIQSLRERLAAIAKERGKKAAWWSGAIAVVGAAWLGLEQGFISPGFLTKAYADSTLETKEHAAETYHTKEDARELQRASDIAHIRMQGAIDAMEQIQAERDERLNERLDKQDRKLDLLLWDRKIKPPEEP